MDSFTKVSLFSVCVIDGKTYAHKESIPTDNACRICECISGEMTCADEICEEPDDGCEQMPATKDECCVYKCESDETPTVSGRFFFQSLSADGCSEYHLRISEKNHNSKIKKIFLAITDESWN